MPLKTYFGEILNCPPPPSTHTRPWNNLHYNFQYLLKSPGDISTDQASRNLLLTDVYAYIYGLPPKVMNEVFSTGANIHNIRELNIFQTQIHTWSRYGLNSIIYKATQRWNDTHTENLCFTHFSTRMAV